MHRTDIQGLVTVSEFLSVAARLPIVRSNVADYIWITPDQYNDQHTTLANGYGQYPNSGSTADSALSWPGSCP
jgi:hypothetical protein